MLLDHEITIVQLIITAPQICICHPMNPMILWIKIATFNCCSLTKHLYFQIYKPHCWKLLQKPMYSLPQVLHVCQYRFYVSSFWSYLKMISMNVIYFLIQEVFRLSECPMAYKSKKYIKRLSAHIFLEI